MNYVLFSAIGDTDPIRDDYDGPMLHIVRYYRPKRAYLFFTAEMAKRDRDTDCYRKVIHYVMPECEVEKIDTNIENASDFDAFYKLFTDIINRIRKENPDAQILLNISSATPQIKTAMCLEVVSHREPSLFPIQVSTPGQKTNKDVKYFDPYKDDIISEMENNLDKLPEARNRCAEPGLIGIRRSMIKRQVVALIESWEYKGAHDLIRENAGLFTERLLLLLRHAYLRSLPEEKEAEVVARELNMQSELYPVKTHAEKRACEYFLVAKLRKDRGELTDFVLRTVTLTEHLLYVDIGKKLGGWDKIADKQRRKERDVLILDRNKAGQNLPDLFKYLDSEFKPGYNENNPINFRTLETIAGCLKITGYEKLFAVRNIRNDSAHELESVTNATLAKANTSAIELQRTLEAKIKDIYGNEIKQAIFRIFDTINSHIKDELDN